MKPLVLFLLLTGCAASPTSSDAPLRVGVAEVEITPPAGYRMSGYFHERRSTGIKDPLKAKALVLEQGETTIALVACDLSGIPASASSKAREKASGKTGIPAANITVFATHTHTGPLYFGIMNTILNERSGPQEFDYAAMLTDRIAEAVGKAHAALRPAALEAGTAQESGLSFNRRYRMKDGSVRTNPGALNKDVVRPMGPIDPEVGLLRVSGSGGPAALLTIFACHCDTVGGTEYSADYPFFLERELRSALGAGFISLFGAGTCGNINHIDVATKERRKTEDIGTALAKTVLAGLPSLSPLHPSLAMKSVRVEAPVQRVTPEEVADARKNVDKVGGKDLPSLDQVRICTLLHLADLPASWPLEVQAIRLGRDTAIVTLPGEIFVEHGLAIKKASPFKHTFVIELANDNCAYVPNRDAYAQKAYEVMNSRLEPGGGEMLVDAAIRMLKELAP